MAYGGTTYRPLVEILRERRRARGAVPHALAGEDNEQLLAERLEAAGGLSSATFTTEEIFWAVRRFVELNARERPVVLVVDDAHWAEPTFHDLVDYLAAFVTQAPVSLIRLGEARAPRPPPDPAGNRDDRARAARGDRRGGPARRSGSTEARASRDHGGRRGEPALPRAVGRGRRRRGAGRASIPPTIEAVIGARLDQLPRRELALLECASVIGRRFDLRALVELARPEDSLHAISSLVALTRAGLVRPAPGPAGEDRYRFAHGLVRDAAYARIPKTQRAHLHEALARRLLADATRTPAADDLAGHHLEQACRALRALGRDAERARGLGEEAAALLETAGRRAAARDDVPAAIALLERAAGLLTDDSPRRGEVRRELGRGLWEIGENERSLERSTSRSWMRRRRRPEGGMARARRPRRLPPRARDGGRAARGGGAGDRDLRRASRRLGAGARLAPDGVRRAPRRALRRIGRAVRTRRRVRARGRRRLRGVAGNRQSLHRAALRPGAGGGGGRRCRALLSDADGRPATQANILASLAELEAMLGRFEEARDAYGRSRAIYEELGLRMPLAGLTTIGAELELLAGDPVAAEAEARRGLAVVEGSGLEVELLPLVAEALIAQGREAEAEPLLADADADADAHSIPWQVRLRTARARLLASRGEVASALVEARVAVERAALLDDVNLSADAYAALAHVLEVDGSTAEASAARAAAYERYVLKGNRVAADAIAASSRA